MKVSVQMTLRIEAEEFERFKACAEEAGLSVPMWLIATARAALGGQS